MRFRSQVVIVTGGGVGIGRGIALAFGREGANVVLAARTGPKLDAVAAELKALGTDPLVHVADVAQERAVESMIAATMAPAALSPMSHGMAAAARRRGMGLVD